MRLRFFLWASADLGVRRSKVASSFCRSGYIELLQGNSSQLRYRKVFSGSSGPLDWPGGWSRPSWYFLNSTLEEELQRKLHQPRITSLGHLAKLRSVGGVSI